MDDLGVPTFQETSIFYLVNKTTKTNESWYWEFIHNVHDIVDLLMIFNKSWNSTNEYDMIWLVYVDLTIFKSSSLDVRSFHANMGLGSQIPS